MKNRLIKKKKIYIKKKKKKKKERKKKKKFYRIFLTAILLTKSCKNNSKTLFLHCIGLYLIFTIWRLDLQRRPTKFGRAYAFFFFFFFSAHENEWLINNLPFQAF